MGSKRAVLWDMDGVLVDSGELHYQAWLQTLTELLIPFDRQKFQATFGMNNLGILTILIGEPPTPEFLWQVNDRKEGLFRGMIHGQLELLPGALQWLSRLQNEGYLEAVASSAPYENIDAIVDELDIRKYFSAMISAYAMPGKPDPAVFLEAAQQLGVKPADCTVVEDSIAGVTAAKNARMRCIAVTNTHARPSLSAADIVINSLDDLVLDDFTPPY